MKEKMCLNAAACSKTPGNDCQVGFQIPVNGARNGFRGTERETDTLTDEILSLSLQIVYRIFHAFRNTFSKSN